MNIYIKKEVFRKFHSELNIAFILAEGINNKKKLEESKHLLAEAEKLVHLEFNKDTIKTHLLISPWAVAQREFGKKAEHYHTSVEKLLQKVLSNKKIHANDTITNLIRHLALKNIIPIGIDDYNKINGGITFDIATGKEKVNAKKLEKGALYYHDAKNILGTKLDYWKSPKTRVARNSTSVLVHFETLPPITKTKLDEVLNEAAALIKTFCGGKINVFILDKKNNSVKI